VYVGHANALKDDLSVTEALTFLLRIHGGRLDPAGIADALSHWGLTAQQHAPVRTLSQGQRRRVALARLAVERRASLWVLDEPFDALDADGIACLNDLLGAHLQRGGSVLITGHQAALDAALPWRELDLDDCEG
jgi:heme exporter protein A